MSKKLEAKINAITNAFRDLISRLDAIDKTYEDLPDGVKTELDLDPMQLDKLPWKPYREGHRSAWIFADLPEAKKLFQAIQNRGTVTVGQFTYRLSHGNDQDFISRNPAK